MNINPQAKRILCFGDSNTYGRIPYGERYSIVERWTGILQQELWDAYEVIEEWRGWRIIYNDKEEDLTKNGALFLEWLLHTHRPVDLVVVMLWTNDIKPIYNLSSQDVCNNMEKYIIPLVQRFWSQWLILSPPSIIDDLHNSFPSWSYKKIKELNNLYKALCKKHTITYIDIQDKLVSWSDWIHLTSDSHYILWTTVAQNIKEII